MSSSDSEIQKTPLQTVPASFLVLNPTPIIEADFEGNLLFTNPAARTYFPGLDGAGKVFELFPDWRQLVAVFLDEAKRSVQREMQVGGNWFLEQIFRVPQNERIRAYLVPINDLKRAQQALERERNLLQAIMDGTKNCHLVYLDRDFNFVRVNAAYAKTCGFATPQEMIGKNHFDLYPQEDNEALFRKVRDTGVAVEVKDKPFVFRDQPERGVTYWDWGLEPLKNEKGEVEGLVFSLVETTARKRIEMKMEENACLLEEYANQMEALAEERAKQLANAERLAAIGQTAGMVGHDIRNPLQAIAGELYLAKEELASMPDTVPRKNLQENLANIEQNLYYIDKIVADLQDFTKPLKPYKEKIKIEKAIEEALLIVTIPNNLQISITVVDCPQFYADLSMLKRILINLIQNAVQAMPKGGALKIHAKCDDKQAYVSVQDTGEGIPLDIKDKLFTPLFTTKSKGQGFGLAVVKRLVDAQGGTINFESEPGKGTTFTVSLPLR
jgi:PAS domain S-box-containing protein